MVEIPDTKPLINHLKHHVDEMFLEMNNDRNDGWIQEHYHNSLIEIRDYINKVLKK